MARGYSDDLRVRVLRRAGIGVLLDSFRANECANYFRNAGYNAPHQVENALADYAEAILVCVCAWTPPQDTPDLKVRDPRFASISRQALLCHPVQ